MSGIVVKHFPPAGNRDITIPVAKAHAIADLLAQLTALRPRAAGEEGCRALAAALGHKVNLIVARAAKIAGEAGLKELVPQMVAAFERFMVNPAGSDKGCAAKQALAMALYEIGSDNVATFLAGIHHVQMEPVFGGAVDSAAELRGACAMGLVRMGYRDVMNELAALLADAEPVARIAAARAAAYTGSDLVVPLLRLRALCPDPEPDVAGECFLAMLKLAPGKALEFVSRFLDGNDAALRDAAALAIGASRHSQAFAVLRQHWRPALPAEFRRTLLLAMATIRTPEAMAMLLSIIESENWACAVEAVEALGLYAHDPAMCEKVKAAVDACGDRRVAEAYQKVFARQGGRDSTPRRFED